MANFLTGSFNTDSWLADARDVFSDKTMSYNSQVQTTKLAFKNLLAVYKDYTTSWWEVQSLDNYIKHKIVPRGLRITLQPSERARSETLLTQWEKEATESSLRFMKILFIEEQNILEKLTQKLKDHIDITLKFKTDPEFDSKEVELQTKLLKHQNFIKDRKHNLFLRDLSDFKDGKAYNFQQKPPPPPKQREGDSDISSSETEFSDRERGYPKNYSYYRPYYQRNRRRQPWGPKHIPPQHMNHATTQGPRYTTDPQSSTSNALPSPSFLGDQRQQLGYNLRSCAIPN